MDARQRRAIPSHHVSLGFESKEEEKNTSNECTHTKQASRRKQEKNTSHSSKRERTRIRKDDIFLRFLTIQLLWFPLARITMSQTSAQFENNNKRKEETQRNPIQSIGIDEFLTHLTIPNRTYNIIHLLHKRSFSFDTWIVVEMLFFFLLLYAVGTIFFSTTAQSLFLLQWSDDQIMHNSIVESSRRAPLTFSRSKKKPHFLLFKSSEPKCDRASPPEETEKKKERDERKKKHCTKRRDIEERCWNCTQVENRSEYSPSVNIVYPL